MCVRVCARTCSGMSVYTKVHADALSIQKKASEPLELKGQAAVSYAMWCWQQSSGRTRCALNCRAVSLDLKEKDPSFRKVKEFNADCPASIFSGFEHRRFVLLIPWFSTFLML